MFDTITQNGGHIVIMPMRCETRSLKIPYIFMAFSFFSFMYNITKKVFLLSLSSDKCDAFKTHNMELPFWIYAKDRLMHT